MSDELAPSERDFKGGADGIAAHQCYRTLVNVVDDGIYQLDTEGQFVAVNDAIVETTGYTREELIGEHISLLLDEDDIDRIEGEIREQLSEEGEKVGSFEVAVETTTGERRPTEFRVTLLLEDGTFRGTVGVVRDISNRNQRQAQFEPTLATSETITSVLDEADVGIFVLDETFDVAWVDTTAAEYFGIDRDAAIGRDKRGLVTEAIQHRVTDGNAFADTVLATYDDNSYVERFECRVTPDDDREERWLEHRSKPIESGRYAGGRVELYYDVTDQHRRVSQLQQLNEAVRLWLEEPSREAVAEQASRYLRDILNMEINGIFLYDSATEELRPTSWTERAEAVFGELPTFAADEGIAWRVFESEEPAAYDDVTDAPDVYDPTTPARSEIVLPIGEHGVAMIGSEKRNAFDDGDLMLAMVVASSLEATFDRLRQERHLERERDLIDRILETTPVGTLVLDENTGPTRINDRATDIFAIGNPETFAPSDRPTYDESGDRLSIAEHPFAQVFATGEPVYDRTLQVERPDGDRRWLSVNAAPVTDEHGEIDRVVTTSEDITALKERERKLESELSRVFERVSDAFYAVDEEYRFTHVNERAEALLGYSEDELLGVRFDELFPETAEIDEIREHFDAAMETQEPTSLEYYSELLGFWVGGSIYPSESGVSVYFRDVTERKEYQRALEESNERLEQFAYAASHDLQEPLRMVSSYLQLLERRYADQLDEDGEEFIDFAVDGADRMKEMIEGLLEYSRVETQGDSFEAVELDTVLEEVFEDLRLQIEESDAEITVGSLPTVEGDAGQLRQVFQNLLDNAIEYSGDEPPRIHVEAERDGRDWLISMRDEGIGIDPDDADRVFEVFQRLHSRDEHAGTGIGLALCRRIVERHGGDIRIESERDDGTTFLFTLPAADDGGL